MSPEDLKEGEALILYIGYYCTFPYKIWFAIGENHLSMFYARTFCRAKQLVKDRGYRLIWVPDET